MFGLSGSDNIFVFIILIFVIIFLVLIMIALVSFFNNFSRELNYLNTEINRTTGNERRYWIRRKRKLWLSLIPFVRY